MGGREGGEREREIEGGKGDGGREGRKEEVEGGRGDRGMEGGRKEGVEGKLEKRQII